MKAVEKGLRVLAAGTAGKEWIVIKGAGIVPTIKDLITGAATGVKSN
jgi:hypothetical protein